MVGVGQREALIAALMTAIVGLIVFVVFLFAPAAVYVTIVAQPLAFLTGGLFVHSFHVLNKFDGLADEEALNPREARRLGHIIEEYEGRLRALISFHLVLTLLNAITPWITQAVGTPQLIAVISLTLNVVAIVSVLVVHGQSAEIGRFKRDISLRRKRRAAQDQARRRIRRRGSGGGTV